MTKLSEYVRVAEAARFLGVSQTTLRKWADAGVFPNRTLPVNGYDAHNTGRRIRPDEFRRLPVAPRVRN